MLRVEIEPNSRSLDGAFLVLKYNGRDLTAQIDEFGIKDGDRVILVDIDGSEDYEISAVLRYRAGFIFLDKPGWVEVREDHQQV